MTTSEGMAILLDLARLRIKNKKEYEKLMKNLEVVQDDVAELMKKALKKMQQEDVKYQ